MSVLPDEGRPLPPFALAAGPALGEHDQEVFGALGCTPGEFADLAAGGVVAGPSDVARY